MNEDDFQVARQFGEFPWHGSIARLAAALLYHQFRRMPLPVEIQIVTSNLYQAASN